jgi:hypothetical protein
MQALAAEMLAKLPDGAPGRMELVRFKEKLDDAVTLLDEACDQLGPEGNPMYRPYTLP